jgi:acylphosphatase
MKKRLEAKVWGKVQGVFFRQNTAGLTQGLILTGWVKNEDDGSVGVLAEGEEVDLKKLLSFLKKGPDHAQVDKVDVNWSEAKGEFKKFEIKY